MLSLAELRRAVRALDARIAGARLQRIVVPDEHSLVLGLYGLGEETHVLLCCRPGFARLSLLADAPPAPPTPPALAQYLRAHLRGGRCTGVALLGEDRVASLRFEDREGAHEILLSLLGPRSNLYLLDGERRVVTSLRPLAETRRDLTLGEPWQAPGSAAPREGEDRWSDVDDADYLAAIERAYAGLEEARARDDLLQQTAHALRREEEFLDKRCAKLAEDLRAATAATETRHLGELLKSVLHTVKPGDERALAHDFATGEEVVIPLDPARSPADNLERLFARYHKAQKGARVLEAQLDELRQRRAAVAALAREAEALGPEPELPALRVFAERRDVRAALGRQVSKAARKAATRPAAAGAPKASGPFAKLPARLRPKVYPTEGGLEIWVGRSDEANDYLTTRLARGNDLFFHVEGVGGSHVILRTGGQKDPPSGALLDACELAVHFSKARNAGRADVHVAAIRDVKKPARAKPGLVHVLRGKTIHLRRDAARLQRLLAGEPA